MQPFYFRTSSKKLLSAGIAALSTAGAFAQQSGDRLEEIIVTAERRAVSTQEMPVSVVAFTQDDLRKQGIDNLSDLQSVVPSLSFVDVGNSKFINIRGVGLTEAAPNQTVGVAIHLDGAYVAREFTVDDAFFDLEGVEVLRGPQGTYVGQNATGGAVFARTKAPTLGQTEGYARVTLGEYEHRLFEGAFSAPLTDTLAVRISLQQESRDSFTDNLGIFGHDTRPEENNQPGNINRHLGRLQALWVPSEEFDLRLIYQTSTRDSDNIAGRANVPYTWDHPWEAAYDLDQHLKNEYERYTAVSNWQITDDFALRTTIAYQDMRQDMLSDNGESAFVFPGTPQSASSVLIEDDYLTAEVNLISTNDSRLQWVLGATWLDYEQHLDFQAIDDYVTTPDWNSGIVLNFDTSMKSKAIFGEIGYALTPELELKVGARYNRDEAALERGSFMQFGGPMSPMIMPVDASDDYEQTTGRVLLNWTPNENHFFYFNVSLGYKPGGWEPTGNLYDSETVLNKEIGWKASFFDARLNTSLSIFDMDYDGFQATIATEVDNPAAMETENVDGTSIRGIDLQVQALIGQLQVGLNGSWLDTEYGNKWVFEAEDTQSPGNPALPTLVNLGGREINYAPEFSGSIYAEYTIQLPNGGMLVPRIDWRYQGGQWTSFFHEPFRRIDSYSTTNLRLTWIPNEQWLVEGYVTNLTDEFYAVNMAGQYPGYVVFGAPRQAGVTFQYSF